MIAEGNMDSASFKKQLSNATLSGMYIAAQFKNEKDSNMGERGSSLISAQNSKSLAKGGFNEYFENAKVSYIFFRYFDLC